MAALGLSDSINEADWVANVALGSGTALSAFGAQAELAIGVVQAVIASGVDPSDIVVTGQSLGGGLAGLAASADQPIETHTFGEGPFENSLAFFARPVAIEAVEPEITAIMNGSMERYAAKSLMQSGLRLSIRPKPSSESG